MPNVDEDKIIGLYHLQIDEDISTPTEKSPKSPISQVSSFSKDLIQAPIEESKLVKQIKQIK